MPLQPCREPGEPDVAGPGALQEMAGEFAVTYPQQRAEK
jgi:hypothetical protein